MRDMAPVHVRTGASPPRFASTSTLEANFLGVREQATLVSIQHAVGYAVPLIMRSWRAAQMQVLRTDTQGALTLRAHHETQHPYSVVVTYCPSAIMVSELAR